MFMRLFTSAIFAGALAGLVGGILQLGFVQPVLLMAELYETGQLVHFGAEPEAISISYAGIDLTRDLWSLAFFHSHLLWLWPYACSVDGDSV